MRIITNLDRFYRNGVGINLFAFICTLFAFISMTAAPVSAATKTWSGSGNCSTDANWSGGTKPTATDDIVLDSTSTSNLTWDSACPQTVSSFSMNTGYTGTVQINTTYTGGGFDVFTITNNLTINAGTVKHKDNSTAETYRLNLSVGGNFTLGASGTINVDGLGYDGGYGSGAGTNGSTNAGGGGAGYGGVGGSGQSGNAGGIAYGSLILPNSLGSGGGSSRNVGDGGSGGGLIQISVTSGLTLNGQISANGVTGSGTPWEGSGGGSGGSVYITAATVSGSGSISANGGSAYLVGNAKGGDGSGGRISIILNSGNDFGSVSITAYGGSASNNKAAAGTVYKKTASQTYGDLIIDNNNQTTASGVDTRISSLVTDTTVGTVTLQNKGNLTIDSGQSLTTAGTGTTLTVGTGTTLTNNGTLNLGGTTFTNSGTITQGSGTTINYTGQTDDSAVTPLAMAYYNIGFNNTGTTFNVPSNNWDINGNLTITAGTLNSNSYDILVQGNWANSGTFTYGTKTVTLDGSNQTISGSTTFYNLTKSVTSAATLTLTDGTTQTISNTLTLNGASGQLLTISGTANLNTNGTASVSYVSVSNNTNVGTKTIIATSSTNGGSNTGWIFPSGNPRYWIGSSATNWNSTSNWSTTSNGSGGASVPGSTEDAIFDGTKNGNTTVDATVNVKGMYLVGYTGTMNQGSNTVTIGTDGLYQSSGTLTATSGTMTVGGNFTRTGGTFDANSGTVKFSGNFSVTSGNTTFNSVIFTGASSIITIVGDMDINGTLTYTNPYGSSWSQVRSSGTSNLNLAGNLSLSRSNGWAGQFGSSGTINIILDGGTNQTVTFIESDSISGLLSIAKSGGSALLGSNVTFGAVTINSNNTLDASPDSGVSSYNLSVSGAFTNNGTFYARGGTHTFSGAFTNAGTFSPGTSTVYFNGGSTVTSGGASYNNVVFGGISHQTATITDNMDINGNLTHTLSVAGHYRNVASSGTVTITLAGNFIQNTSGWWQSTFGSAGTINLVLDGSLDQSLSQTSQEIFQANLTIAKSSGSAILGSNFTVTGKTTTINASNTLDLGTYNFTSSTGFVNNGTLKLAGDNTVTTPTLGANSTVEYTATSGSRSLKNWTYSNLTINGSGGTFLLPATQSALKNLTISAGTLDANGYDMTVSGNWSNSGTFTPGTKTVTLNGSNQQILGATTFYKLTKDISAGSSADTLYFQNGQTQTMSSGGTLTLKGASGKVLFLRSTVNGSKWKINPGTATLVLAYINVKDSNNIATTAINARDTNSISSGYNSNWTFNPVNTNIQGINMQGIDIITE